MAGGRILVTGGMGYIGSHALLEALAAGYEALVVDDFSNAAEDMPERLASLARRPVPVEILDLRDRERLRRVLAGWRPEAVLHFAGRKAVAESVAAPLDYYETNVEGALSLLRAMEAAGCRRIVFSSSATVYGAPVRLPIDEEHPLSVTNPYGRTKLMIEEILADVCAARPGFTAACLRYFNPVGAHPSGEIGEDPLGVPANLMPFVSQVAAGLRDEVAVFGDDYATPDGTGVRDYIHVVDLAEAHVAALRWAERHSGWRAFNLGTGRGLSVLEMIRLFEAESGRRVKWRIAPRRPGDVAACWADPSRAAAELGWRATRDAAAMCRSAWEAQMRRVGRPRI